MLSREAILEATCSGLNVFRHYIAGDWKVKRNFRNPLYDDVNPSCNIFFDRKSNSYRMKDFGNDEYSGDCFYIVGKIKGYDCTIPKDFIEILRTINRDLFLGIEDEARNSSFAPAMKSHSLPPKVEMEEVQVEQNAEVDTLPYYAHSKPFSVAELDYWLSYGINKETLKRFRVVSLSCFESQSRQGKPYKIESLPSEPIFGYEHPNFIKIYRPLSDMRFLYGGDLPENYCFGLEQLPAKGDVLYITGGEKDVLTLSARGFHAICFNSETALIQPSIIRKLSFMFKHIVILYDVDKTGLSSSLKSQQQLSEFGVKRLLLPLPGTKQAKDI